MWLPTKLQVDSASRHAISIAGTAIAIFGLEARGVTSEQVTAVIQSLGSLVNDTVILIGAVAPFYALLKAAHSASPASQVAAVQSIATGPASPVAESAQKALIDATSAVAQDTTIPKSDEAKNTLIAATIALPSVQTIITDQKTADASPSPSVVATSNEPIRLRSSGGS
jgi:hypothetical protein